MATAKITSKGQVTIPKVVRERLGLKPGIEIDFVEERGGFRIEKRLVASPFGKYRGYLKHLAGRDPDEIVGEKRGR